jgi:hypothetical protein
MKGATKLHTGWVISSPPPKKKEGLGDGIGQKKPCHHLGPFFSNFLLEKILGYLKEFLRKKLKSAKKVTKLPALTVLFCYFFLPFFKFVFSWPLKG